MWKNQQKRENTLSRNLSESQKSTVQDCTILVFANFGLFQKIETSLLVKQLDKDFVCVWKRFFSFLFCLDVENNAADKFKQILKIKWHKYSPKCDTRSQNAKPDFQTPCCLRKSTLGPCTLTTVEELCSEPKYHSKTISDLEVDSNLRFRLEGTCPWYFWWLLETVAFFRIFAIKKWHLSRGFSGKH